MKRQSVELSTCNHKDSHNQILYKTPKLYFNSEAWYELQPHNTQNFINAYKKYGCLTDPPSPGCFSKNYIWKKYCELDRSIFLQFLLGMIINSKHPNETYFKRPLSKLFKFIASKEYKLCIDILISQMSKILNETVIDLLMFRPGFSHHKTLKSWFNEKKNEPMGLSLKEELLGSWKGIIPKRQLGFLTIHANEKIKLCLEIHLVFENIKEYSSTYFDRSDQLQSVQHPGQTPKQVQHEWYEQYAAQQAASLQPQDFSTQNKVPPQNNTIYRNFLFMYSRHYQTPLYECCKEIKQCFIPKLKKRPRPQRLMKVEKLLDSLLNNQKAFIAKKIDFDTFKKTCIEHMEDAQKMLKKRHWPQIFINLNTAIDNMRFLHDETPSKHVNSM